MKYQRKPVVVEAVQWKGDNLQEVLMVFPETPLFRLIEDGTLHVIGWAVIGLNHLVVKENNIVEVYTPIKFQDQFTPFSEDNN